MSALINNPLFLSALIGTIIAQVSKFILVLALEKRFAWDRMTETGGMPSSHSAAVAALTTACGLTYGVGSPYFAISLVFGTIVIFDATGVRRAAGKHAEILNSLITEMSHLFEEGDKPKALKTLLGHTYPQVAVGTLLGVFIGYLCTGYLK